VRLTREGFSYSFIVVVSHLVLTDILFLTFLFGRPVARVGVGLEPFSRLPFLTVIHFLGQHTE